MTDWGKAIVDTIVQAGKESTMEMDRNELPDRPPFGDMDEGMLLSEVKWTATRLKLLADECKKQGLQLSVSTWGGKITVKVKTLVLEV